MSQRSIELLIGRLITDEAFRSAMIADASATLSAFEATGHDLTPVEWHALVSCAPEFWCEIAERIDPRLQKVKLR